LQVHGVGNDCTLRLRSSGQLLELGAAWILKYCRDARPLNRNRERKFLFSQIMTDTFKMPSGRGVRRLRLANDLPNSKCKLITAIKYILHGLPLSSQWGVNVSLCFATTENSGSGYSFLAHALSCCCLLWLLWLLLLALILSFCLICSGYFSDWRCRR
jgi:hypothetical protein